MNTKERVFSSIVVIFAVLFVSVLIQAVTGEAFFAAIGQLVVLLLILLAVVKSYQKKFPKNQHIADK